MAKAPALAARSRPIHQWLSARSLATPKAAQDAPASSGSRQASPGVRGKALPYSAQLGFPVPPFPPLYPADGTRLSGSPVVTSSEVVDDLLLIEPLLFFNGLPHIIFLEAGTRTSGSPRAH